MYPFLSTLKKERGTLGHRKAGKKSIECQSQGQEGLFCNHFVAKVLTYGSALVCSCPLSASSFFLIGYESTENISYDQQSLLGTTKGID